MPEEIASARFHEVGWRVLAYAASVHFRTVSFAEGLRLADAIGGLADESGHRAHLDLRATGLTVRLPVNEEGRLTDADVVLAGRISASAADLGAKVDIAGLQMTQIAIDALVIPDIVPFWAAVLGYETLGDTLIDPDGNSQRHRATRQFGFLYRAARRWQISRERECASGRFDRTSRLSN